MQYEAESPAEYLEQLDDDWRRDTLLELRELIQEKGPELEEKINYKMLAYGDERGELFHLTAQRNYVSLYVGDKTKVDPNGELLAGIDAGKGCLRFKKSTAVDDTRIDDFIERAVEIWTSGGDVDC